MSLTESIVEDAALTGFGKLGYEIGYGPQMRATIRRYRIVQTERS